MTAAIWSCREDIVAILVGQAILIRPLFTRSFWTRDFASISRARLNPPGDENDSKTANGGGYALSQVRFRTTARDPFSLSAALASLGGSEAADKEVESSGASMLSTSSRGAMPPRVPDKDGGGTRGAPPAGLVINVSRQVEVERVESPTGRAEGRGDCLQATNQAVCWKGEGVRLDGGGHGDGGTSGGRERVRG